MNSEDIHPGDDHNSPPPFPNGTCKKRFREAEKAWPTVDQLAHLAAALAQAYPKANSDELVGKSLSLWCSAKRQLKGFFRDPLGYEFSMTFEPESHPYCKRKTVPLDFDGVLRLIVGIKTRLPDRHKKFRDYLAANSPDAEAEFAELKQKGFGSKFDGHLRGFKAWQESNGRLQRKATAKKAAAARHHPKEK